MKTKRVPHGSQSQNNTIIIPELEEAALHYSPRAKPWIPGGRDELTLKTYYGRVDIKDLAKALNRSIPSIKNKAVALGLHVWEAKA
ncbi:MAG: hypothetical protein ABR999_10880 [Methanoregula sp.]|jgi:hypothetical protein|uniref:hypothetical protein n=1 Tax=Methanoregula sp. TaxID=2052170 RepID=UPI003D0F5AD9